MMKTIRRFVLVAFLLAAVATQAQQYRGGIDINVRSGVEWSEQQKRDHDLAYALLVMCVRADPAERTVHLFAPALLNSPTAALSNRAAAF